MRTRPYCVTLSFRARCARLRRTRDGTSVSFAARRHSRAMLKAFRRPCGCSPAGLRPTATAAGAIATAEAAARVLRLRARLVHGERAAPQLVLVQLRDGRLGFLVRRHFHEPEAPCPTGRHVAHDAHRVDGTELFEQLLQLRLASLVGEVSDVQFSTHLYTPCALVPSAVRRLAVRRLEPSAFRRDLTRGRSPAAEAIVSRSTLCPCRDRTSQ